MTTGGGMEPLGLRLVLEGVDWFIGKGKQVTQVVNQMKASFTGAAAASPRFSAAFKTQAGAMDAAYRAGLTYNKGLQRFQDSSGKMVSFADAQNRALAYSSEAFKRAGISAEEFDQQILNTGRAFGDVTPEQLTFFKQNEEIAEGMDKGKEKASG